ncbi:MAG TPA: glutathione S-transferase [Hyphomicrobiaceae bacterium]|jgi:glutathione S-transferase|nr:glutathione S-transferase [Hyphomicrobiaceae bacterium]
MKLLQTKTAPNPRRVRIFLAEKGIEVPCEEVDLMHGALKTPAFTAVNPFQRVPVLVLDDGTAIAETMAICRYFEELKPEPRLFGAGPVAVATVEMWSRRMDLGLLLSVAQAFRHLHPAMAKLEVPQVPAWGEANKPRALEILTIMDDQLANRRFLAGEHYSVADITGLVAIDFMKPARIERPPGLKNLARWYEDVASRPSAKA